jgi:hypothetical protein
MDEFVDGKQLKRSDLYLGRGLVLWALCLAVLLGGSVAAWGRSSATARWASDAIAGPDIDQRLALYLHYFPGDGEAVLRTIIRCGAPIELKDGQTTSAEVRQLAGSLEIDYSAAPLLAGASDTLWVDMVGSNADGRAECSAEIFSSLAPEEAAHQAGFTLGVKPTIPLELTVAPHKFFPGTNAALEIVVRHAGDTEVLGGVDWHLPAQFELVKGKLQTRWAKGLKPGQADTLRWRLRPSTSGVYALTGRAFSDGTAGSPIPEISLEVGAVPSAGLDTSFFEVGGRGDFVYRVSNTSDKTISLDSLKIEIPSAFAAVEAQAGGWQVRVRQSDAENSGAIVLYGGGALTPGTEVAIGISADMLRPGPYVWAGFFTPAGLDNQIDLAGQAVLNVVWPRIDTGWDLADRDKTEGNTKENDILTDLELVARAFDKPLEQALADIGPLQGTPVYLEALEKGDKNWAVDEALTQALVDRGYVVTLKEPEAETDGAWLRYRLAEVRVVYRKKQSFWNPFSKRTVREAAGDLFLEFEKGGKLEWVRRVRAYARQQAGGDLDLLEESQIVERTVVQQDSKLIERGLTLGIVSGLFFIFFAP